MKAIYTLFIFTLFSVGNAGAQKLLQIEKIGSAKTIKLAQGSYLEYRLYAYEEWQAGYIEKLIPEEDIVVLNDRYIKLSDIQSIRFNTPQRWSKPASKSLYTFGAAWAVFSAGAALIDKDDKYTWGDAAVTGTSFALGFLVERIFRFKKYHFHRKNRLRILDLDVEG
ncbi:MAG: hypothetical protein GYB31_17140 [Bacteroidetes bacterium]|nr:hypothetical protein [Bacteroidota bacterium]